MAPLNFIRRLTLLNSKTKVTIGLGRSITGLNYHRSVLFSTLQTFGSNKVDKISLVEYNAKDQRSGTLTLLKRSFSEAGKTNASGDAEEKETKHDGKDGKEKTEGEEEYAEPEEEKISYVQLAGYLALLGVVGVCGYNIVTELFPSRMSPNNIFNEAFERLQGNAEIASRYGTPLNAYGKDHGGKREGRRNFIENVSYKGDDGSNRIRVRFNLKGPYGHGFVYAEVSDKMNPGEYVYLMVQNARDGSTNIIEDNRLALASKAKEAGGDSSTSGGASAAMNRLRFGGN
mmetsp:Transcript_9001/g.11952  ORF Transcript_9001/g.11952 Transcript_9001/m.11952 type:complete len:287 (-) Transcript_9001:303-1163(-)|eukprot:CAMPEP_0117755180 /NCGR_PEP_ID=MMETSP0947-20121206/13293_1 /TAXON_ID=44440 /ORGANISM="Chattonella subsalsa, Strain CCMP2191" /LENGTH=286 /DNA_ID=CAMNT_0005574455 /DNA_START=125 /DNA_END=985 /DNA_ORIENTATION=+